jgi:hypothetical protein
MKWAVQHSDDEDECEDIDCDFFADLFNEKVLGDGAPELPGLAASHQRIPMQGVMEMLGSEYIRALSWRITGTKWMSTSLDNGNI